LEKLTNKMYFKLVTLSNTVVHATFNTFNQTTSLKTTVCLHSSSHFFLLNNIEAYYKIS